METRIEHDFLGEREVPAAAYYGIQTLRAVENFPLSGIRLSSFPEFVNALAMVKKACALANLELGNLEEAKARAIIAACDEIIGGKLHDQFVVDMVQGGAGTSTNMNANEVIANRALELLVHRKGEYQYLHPNDDVNRSQSTNDRYPSAVKIGVALTGRSTLRHQSIGIVTALTPVIGYERAAAVAQEALATGASVSALVLARGWLSAEQLADILAPEKMTRPRRLPVVS